MNFAQPIHEGILLNQLKHLFHDAVTHVRSRKHSCIKDPTTGAYLELDAWIPEYGLSFEFQDAYHYIPIWYKQVTQHGTTLIYIPCWWNGALESLMAAIHFQRPDLFTSVAHPIPLNPPAEYFQVFGGVPDVGGLMLASFPSDPNFGSSVSSRTWWMGEKYDGVRLCWNASRNSIFSRTGKMLSVLPSMVHRLPATAMCTDGEFWFGRGQFAHTCLLFFGTQALVNWDSLRALLFDVSTRESHSQPFERRYSHLLSMVAASSPLCIVVPRALCEDADHLRVMARSILEGDGEGVIMRRFGSLYDTGRSQNLIKLKRFQGDQDAIVVRIGKGEEPVTVKLPAGQTIDVSLHNVYVPNLKIGDVVTFSFESNVRRESPVNPQIYRIRTDLSWEDVVNNLPTEQKGLNAKSQVKGTTSALIALWKDVGKRRELFENYAKRNRFNALHVEDWYSQSIKRILSAKGAIGIVRHYGNSVTQALLHLFPDIGFVTPCNRSWWSDTNNPRRLLEKFAKDNGFDAYSADKWHSQSRKTLMDVVGINIVVRHYGGVTKALLKLFPNIGLDRLKFRLDYYKKVEHRRRLFEQYAIEKSMDPYKSKDWYNVSMDLPRLVTVEGIDQVLFYHGSNLLQAIIDLFPNIGLEKSRLHANYRAGRRRRIFEHFAASAGFDPLSPENWYMQSTEQILAAEGVRRVISHYDNSLSKALVDLFPDIGMEEIKFQVPEWRDITTRRRFFEDYASKHGIDPTNLDDWYTSPLSSKELPREAARLLLYHNNRAQQALIDLFPELKLEEAYFNSHRYWSDPLNRRKFFLKYADVHGVDPLDPLSWNSQPVSRIMASKGAQKVMAHHVNVTKALSELFSGSGFNSQRLQLKYYPLLC